MRSVLSLALVGLFLLPAAFAGSPSAPEVNDTDSDLGVAGRKYVDIVKMWVTSDPESVYFNIQLRDLGTGNPSDTGSTRYLYQVEYTTQYGRWTTDGVICYSDLGEGIGTRTSAGVLFVCAGASSRTSSGVPTQIAIDPETDMVTLTVGRESGGFPLGAGVLSAFKVTTGASKEHPYPGPSGGLAGFGPAFSPVDVANAPSSSYALT